MTAWVDIRELAAHDGTEVKIRGWICGKRSGGKIIFLMVRDGTGRCQCIVEASNEETFAVASELSLESSVTVSGSVRSDDRAVGAHEIAVTHVECIQHAEDFPITRKAHGTDFLMAHRHLWLRSGRQNIILRMRHSLVAACREFFDQRGFILIDTPILTRGAGEDAQTLFPVDYFDQTLFLAQTGQLYLESACMSLGKVYCFGPTFRAEKSKTRRHLAEFWMLEPEVAFADLDEVIQLAEDLVCHVIEKMLSRHENDFAELGRDTASLAAAKGPFPRITYTEAADILTGDATRQNLEREMESGREQLAGDMQRLAELEGRHEEAAKAWKREKLADEIRTLREEIRELELAVEAIPSHMELAASFEWGKDLGGSDETIISKHFGRPVFVTEYPREAKAFYMKRSESDPRVVRNVDLLAPEGYGEIIGGSQREDDYETLLSRIKEHNLDPEDYSWYLDLRKYGSVPHGGFGLGIERLLAWICGLNHVRETIPFPRLMGRIDM